MNVTVFHGFRATFSGPVSGTSTLSSLAPSVAGAVLGASGAGAALMPAPGHWNIHLIRVCIHRFFRYFLKFCFIFFKKHVLNFDAFGHSLSSFTWARHTEWPCCHCAVTATLCFWCLWSALKGSRGSLHGNRIEGLPRGFGVVLSCKSLQRSYASTKHTLTGLECWKIACEAAQGTCI